MKNLYLFFALAFFALNANSQSFPIDFSTTLHSFSTFNGSQFSIISDPDDATNNVGEIKNSGTSEWEGGALSLKTGVDLASSRIITLRAYNFNTNQNVVLFKFEDGTKMIAETGKDIVKNEDWSILGAISRIELTNYGTGYTPTSLPTITVSTTTGSSANLIATNIQGKSANVSIDVANNATGIGSIREITVKDFGINYTTATANFNIEYSLESLSPGHSRMTLDR